MNPNAGLVIEDKETGKVQKTHKSRVVVYVVFGAVLLFLIIFWSLGAIDDGEKKNVAPTSKDAVAQQKYAEQQKQRSEQKAARLKDTPLVVQAEKKKGSDVDAMLRDLERKREERIKEIRKEQEAKGGKAKLLEQILNTPSPKPATTPTNVVQETTKNAISTVSGNRPVFKVSGANAEEQQMSYEIQRKNDELDRQTMFAFSRRLKSARVYEAPEKQRVKEKAISTERRVSGLKTKRNSWAQKDTGKDEITAVMYTDNKPVKVFEGEFIDCVLLNKIVSDTEESPVVCAVSRDVIDNSGEWVVIPANTRIIGKSAKITYMGATRMFISFERMILPGGESVRFPYNKRALRALDKTGALGAVSDVNRHWMLQFGAALCVGVLDGLAGAAQNRVDQNSGASFVIDRTSDNFGKILDTIMQRYTNIVPTITVWQGASMKIYVSTDVLISPFCKVQERSYAKNWSY